MTLIDISRQTFVGRFCTYILFVFLTGFWYSLVILLPLGFLRDVQTVFVVFHFFCLYSLYSRFC